MTVARHRARLQRKASGGQEGKAARPDIPESGGAPLDGQTRERMEGNLGSDLSGVRVHTGGESAQASRDVGARAFTVGSDVHFASGQFAPGTKEGDRLLAHELTHVVQGSKSGVHRKAEKADEEVDVSQPHEPAEVEADEMGDHVADKLHGERKKGEAKTAKQAAPPKINAKLDAGLSPKLWRSPTETAAPAGPTGGDEKKEEKKADPVKATGDVDGFEQAMGLEALRHPATTSTTDGLMGRVMTVIEDRARQMDKQDAETDAKKDTVDQLLSKMGGSTRAGVAGGVGNNADTLRQVMAPATGGTIREKMTVFFNFSGAFQEMILKQTDPEREEFLSKAHVEGDKIRERLAHLEEEEGATKDTKGAYNIPKGADGRDKPPPLINADAAEGLQNDARERPAKGAAPAEANPTVGELGENKETKLGQAELDTMFPDKKGEGGHVDPEEVKQQAVTWAMGVNAWKAKADSKFADDLKQLNLPFGAGPSGTTARIFSTAEYLGAPKDANLRIACIGYLVPIHAHSLLEVVEGAKTHGVDAPDFRALGADVYEQLAPYDPDKVKTLKKQFGLPVKDEEKKDEAPAVGGSSAPAPPPAAT